MKKTFLSLLATALWLASLSLASAEVQTFTTLAPGWNLITFQVQPSNPAPAAVFDTLPGFQAAWTFDAATGDWTRYAKSNDAAKDARENSLPSAAMSNIAVGKAYWVFLGSAPISWSVTGTVPTGAAFPALNLTKDSWNLIGIPTGSTDLAAEGYLKSGETINLLSVLTRAGFDYSHILRWEQTFQRLQKATPQNNDVDEFATLDPWRGYFLYVVDPQVLRPILLPAVRGDVDAEPQGNYPGHEDLKISSSSTPLDGKVQTHIQFQPGEDVQTLGISNVGGGIMAWEVIWTPTDATNTPEPWLTVASSPTDDTDYAADPENPTRRISTTNRDWTRLRGITTLENDIIYLRLDRKNLAAGTYKGTLTLRTSVGDRSWQVSASVPGLKGEWRGLAKIATVNGKQNRPPDVDLQVSFFEDSKNGGLVRGMIDSTQSLLWPVDVPLVGYITDSRGNAFNLGGAFVLPPGDQNLPPYDSVTGNLTAEDVDWNNNGKLDNLNPFPFPIHREVQLVGSLTEASPFKGYKISGQYIEVVSGMLRRSIRVLGTFELTRENPTPFANRNVPAIINIPAENPETGRDPVVKRVRQLPSPAALPIAAGTQTVTFVTDLALSSLSVNVKLDTTGLTPANLTMKLIAPGNKELILHDREAIPVSTLADITYPGSRSPVSDLESFIRSLTTTKGVWSLVTSGASGGKLKEFSVTLAGQPLFSVTGRITDSQNPTQGVPGAQVTITNLPINNVTATTDANGNFTFNGIAGIPLNFSTSLSGWTFPNLSIPGLGSSFTLPGFTATPGNTEEARLLGKFQPLPAVPFSDLGVAGFGAGGASTKFQVEIQRETGPAKIVPGPLVTGYAPLTVDFAAVGSITGPVTWNFGDTTTGTGANVTKTFATNGSYTVTFAHGGAAPQVVHVLVMPSPGHSTAANNFFQVFQSAGGAIPATPLSPGTSSTATVLKVDLTTLQHTYSASADIDLAPFTTAGNRAYEADNFDSGGVGSFTADGRNRSPLGFKDEDHNYNVGDPSAGWPGNRFVWYDIVTNDNYAARAGYAQDEGTFHPHPKVPNNGDVPTTHYRMTCNLGASILPAPNVDLPPDASGIARNRTYQLVTGPLAVFQTPTP